MSVRLKIILLAGLLILIGFFAGCFHYWRVDKAWADSSDAALTPLRGWAWAETVGWFSFNCCDSAYAVGCNDNCKTGGVDHKYLVTVDANNKLQGHAWSANVGWLSFDNNGNDCPIVDSAHGCGAWFDATDNKIKGWAKVLSLADSGGDSYGWVKLNDNGNPAYGVSVIKTNNDVNQQDWGDFQGWAWNGYDNKRGLGWLSFDCDSNSHCAGNKYKVTAQPIKPAVGSVTPTEGQDSQSATIEWNAVYGAVNYEILRQDYVCDQDNAINCHHGFNDSCKQGNTDFGPCILATNIKATPLLAGDAVNYTDIGLTPFATYLYRVRAKNSLGGIASDQYAEYTVSPVSMSGLDAVGVCAADKIVIDLSWRANFTWNTGLLSDYEIQYCVTKTGGACAEADFSAASSLPSTDSFVKWRQTVTAGSLFTALHGYQYITYRVRAIGKNKVCKGDGQNNIPCNGNSSCPGVGQCETTMICQGGAYGGLACDSDSACAGAKCAYSKSAWYYAPAKQICYPNTDYKEVRPAN